jgi:hypothetical protein
MTPIAVTHPIALQTTFTINPLFLLDMTLDNLQNTHTIFVPI